jgi:hypothetical protein
MAKLKSFEEFSIKKQQTLEHKGTKHEEEEVEEGNAFGDAVRKAKEAGDSEFEFEGETFKVEEQEEAITEQPINEASAFGPKTVKANDWDKTDVKKITKLKHKLSADHELTWGSMEYYTSDSIGTLNGDIMRILDPNENYRKQISFKLKVNGELMDFGIIEGDKDGIEEENEVIVCTVSRKTANKIYVNADESIPLTFYDIIDQLILKKYADDVINVITDLGGVLPLYVIPIGSIPATTGKTKFGWGIFNDSAYVSVCDNGALLYSSGVLDTESSKYKLVDNDKHKKTYSGTITIVDSFKSTKENLIKYYKKKGYKTPVRAFQKQTGRQPMEMFSVK